jgi:hypothetical protein
MNRFKFALALMVLAMAMFTSRAQAANEVQIDRFEFGVSAGVGFYVGQHDPLGTGVVTRVQTYDAVGFPDGNDHGMPGVETFGFSVGYRFNPFWHIKAQTTRQRVSFVEYLNKDYATHALYYNAMWHTDVMAEYNLLPYGLSEGGARVRKFTPYLGFGLGVTVFNKDAQLRHINGKSGPKNDFAGTGCYYTCYPRVGQQQIYDANGNLSWQKSETACALYIPVAAGVKWRINDNIQLKGTCQYQLFFSGNKLGGLNSNLEGGAFVESKLPDFPAYMMTGRPTFDQLRKQIVGANHDCMFSISAIFNFGHWYEDRLITY